MRQSRGHGVEHHVDVGDKDLTDAAFHVELSLALRAIRLFPPQSR